jgi:hypothetical protein
VNKFRAHNTDTTSVDDLFSYMGYIFCSYSEGLSRFRTLMWWSVIGKTKPMRRSDEYVSKTSLKWKKNPRHSFGWVEKYTDLQEISALTSYAMNLNASHTYRMKSIFIFRSGIKISRCSIAIALLIRFKLFDWEVLRISREILKERNVVVIWYFKKIKTQKLEEMSVRNLLYT